jgi:hypothetical protein
MRSPKPCARAADVIGQGLSRLSKQTDARSLRQHLVNGPHKVESSSLGGLQLEELELIHNEDHAAHNWNPAHRPET